MVQAISSRMSAVNTISCASHYPPDTSLTTTNDDAINDDCKDDEKEHVSVKMHEWESEHFEVYKDYQKQHNAITTCFVVHASETDEVARYNLESKMKKSKLEKHVILDKCNFKQWWVTAPMLKNGTLVEQLIKTYEVNAGWTEERKLRGALERLDISVYTQTNGQKVLVSSKELNDHLRKFEQIEAQRKEMESHRGE